MSLDDKTKTALFEYLLRLGDDKLVLGHRLSELCAHGPILEQDIALANIALDSIGQAQALLQLAGDVEGRGRSADDLAYHRDEYDFRNALLVEQPNGDFAVTLTRQFLFDVFGFHLYEKLARSAYGPLAGVAAKALKEIRYHARHSGDWMLRLGDGTEESHRRTQDALDSLWTYTGELFETDEKVTRLAAQGIAPRGQEIQTEWLATVAEHLGRATLTVPQEEFMASGGRTGRHSEHLGHMLAEMQILARSIPGAEW